MGTIKNTERRKNKRHLLATKTFVISPKGVGYLLDISRGGFSAQYFYSAFNPGSEWTTNLVIVGGNQAKDLPISITWIKNSEEYPFCKEPYQKIGFMFKKLTNFQRDQINSIITCHTKEAA